MWWREVCRQNVDMHAAYTCYNGLESVINPLEIFLTWISSVQSLSCVQFFVTSWTAAHQASLSITNFQSLPKLMSIELVMPSNHVILCCPLLLPPSIFPSIKVYSSSLYFARDAAAAAKSLQLCPTMCNTTDSSPPGSLVPGIVQARTLEWVAIAFPVCHR